jgi:hypothetical protein
MKREAVQEERHKSRGETDDKNNSSFRDLESSMLSPNVSQMTIQDENSQSMHQSMLDLIENATLTYSDNKFLDRLVEAEAKWYPRVDNVIETVCAPRNE